MDVPIDHADASLAMGTLRVFDGKHDAAEHAISATSIGFGVVTGGTNQRIGIFDIPGEHGIDRFETTAGGKQCDLVTSMPYRRAVPDRSPPACEIARTRSM